MNEFALYIHWPFCLSKCPYCDFNSHVREKVDAQRWERALLKEMETMAARAECGRAASIFFGGGTPSLMPPATVKALIERAEALFGFAPGIEITLEANPTSVEAERFAGFRAAGVNRVSLGVQSLDDAELRFLGRGHGAEEALAAVRLAAEIFPRYSFDLIYARPNQSVEEWEAELLRALKHARGHLSLYQLTIEENTAFHHAYAKGGFTLPDEETAALLYRRTQEIMEAEGMPAYEISNHARPGEESRHNLAYWGGRDYLGVGPGAHGRLNLGSRPEASPQRVATQTIKSPERWLEAVEREGHGLELWQALEREEKEEEKLMMRMRLTKGFALADMPFIARDALPRLTALGLLADIPGRVQTTLKGRLVLNYLTAELLA